MLQLYATTIISSSAIWQNPHQLQLQRPHRKSPQRQWEFTACPQRRKGSKKKLGHKIINVTYPDNTPFGWAFDNLYDTKDFVNHLSNRDGKVTIFGGIEFQPLSNLTTKWVKSLMLGNLLWIIHIDTTKNGMKDSFPMQAHLAFANKIAWAITSQNIWQEGGIDVVGVSLNVLQAQVADLMAHFYTNTFDEAMEAFFQEAIKVAKEEVESLI
jgi:hypothetical protein